jgi:tyrosyl-tRNA synthetase
MNIRVGRNISTVLQYLQSKNLIANTSNNLLQFCQVNKPTVYSGFDPTAPSLHIGHLMNIVALNTFAAFGSRTIFLIGDATASLGDPSDKDKTRPRLSSKEISENSAQILSQLKAINNHIHNQPDFQKLIESQNTTYIEPLYVNNKTFYEHLNALDYLNSIGGNFKVSTMIGRHWVQNRLKAKETILFSEFAYSTLQSHDYYLLHKQHNCCLQIGGADQWGNIAAGIEYVKKAANTTVHGLTVPLLLDANGKKLSKSSVYAINREAIISCSTTHTQYISTLSILPISIR